jgi:AGCS family alanine or glycine:cation symporter
MLEYIAGTLHFFEDILWIYFCFPALLILGLLLTIQGRFIQIRGFPAAVAHFWSLLNHRQTVEGTVHPIQAFFACIGGCVGIGNIVAICTAVQLGGPGALIWLWFTAIFGGILKYSEVYLGFHFRVRDSAGNYRGGPMYYLRHVFKSSWIPVFVGLLLCLYSVEIYQFSIVTTSLSNNFGWSKEAVIAILLCLVAYAGYGGVGRVGKIAGTIIPSFILIYVGMGMWVIYQHAHLLPSALMSAFSAAFTGHAAVGGFAGSTVLMALTHSMRRVCYSSDLGIGYASVVHSESGETRPAKQASLVMIEIFIDSFLICTTSILLILVTGVWQSDLHQEMLVQAALATSFPYVDIFMPVFIFLLGYSTINVYFVVGLNSAQYLGGKVGRLLYFAYACLTFALFAYVDSLLAQTVMTIIGGILLLFNSYAIFTLRHVISFGVKAPTITSSHQHIPMPSN